MRRSVANGGRGGKHFSPQDAGKLASLSNLVSVQCGVLVEQQLVSFSPGAMKQYLRPWSFRGNIFFIEVFSELSDVQISPFRHRDDRPRVVLRLPPHVFFDEIAGFRTSSRSYHLKYDVP